MKSKILKERLKYPHKRTALKYFLRNPSLSFVISQNPSKFYFSKTLENVLDSNFMWLYDSYRWMFEDWVKEAVAMDKTMFEQAPVVDVE